MAGTSGHHGAKAAFAEVTASGLTAPAAIWPVTSDRLLKVHGDLVAHQRRGPPELPPL